MICPYKPMLRVQKTEQRRYCGNGGFTLETKYCYELQQCSKDRCASWSTAQNGCKYHGWNNSEKL